MQKGLTGYNCQMQFVAEISQGCGRSAWEFAKAVISAVLKIYVLLTAPLVGIAFVLSLLVGGEALTPLWFYLEESTSIYLQVLFWALIPSSLFALVSAVGYWCVAWCRYIPGAYSPHLRRARRYFLQTAVAWITAKQCGNPSPWDLRCRLRTATFLTPLPALAPLGLSTSTQLLE